MQATGVAVAIAHVLGKGDALKKFHRQLMPRGGGGGGSRDMQELRRRIHQLVDLSPKGKK